MKILVLNGPNLNMLGKRDTNQYGSLTLEEINNSLTEIAHKNSVELLFFQSNHEGALIDFIQQNIKDVHGILINPGALTHYGYSLRDSLADTNLPIVEVHLSDIYQREAFRKINVVTDIVVDSVIGLKQESYYEGLRRLIEYINKNSK